MGAVMNAILTTLIVVMVKFILRYFATAVTE